MKFAVLLISIFALAVSMSTSASADENVRSVRELRRLGYRPFSEFKKSYPTTGRLTLQKLLRRQNSLPWPVPFLDNKEPIGNSMIQFQNYGFAYYHGGDDLLSKDQYWVTTPVSGWLEGGHYGYSGNPDGSMTKHWIPWPNSGDEMYFELAIITDEGLRFEFHHVDRQTLPAETIAALNKGRVRIEAGTKIGKVVDWGSYYDHVHYNIVTPEGLRINPEFVSEMIPDNQEPEVEGIYAIDENNKVQAFTGGKLSYRPKEFIVAGFDRKNSKSPYKHPFHMTMLRFESGAVSGWDFRAVMKTLDGHWPSLTEFYLPSLRTPRGATLKTFGDYGDGFNLVRLKVPANASGKFVIEIADMNGNRKTLMGEL
jgi:hypothetical protein